MKKDKFNIILIILLAIIIGLGLYILLFNRVKVSSISVTNKGMSIFVGESKKVEVNIEPMEAKDKPLTYISSDENIAKVDELGNITGINDGLAIITVKDKDSNISDSLMVRIINKEAEILEFYEKDVEIRINESRELGIVINPIELKELISWTSSDERIVTVDNKGNITGLSNGKAIVKAIYGDKEALINVKVVLPVDSVDIEEKNVVLDINKTYELKPIILPETVSNQELTWVSSNPDIATVENNIVTGISEGTSLITGTIDGKMVNVEVKVIIPVESITLNKTSINMKKGESIDLVATINPSNATNTDIIWTSSNPKIVKVDNGKVTGLGTGIITITATIDGVSAKCEVTSIGDVITNKNFPGYNLVDQYNSETLKYRIMKNGRNYYSIIWVMDANKQWNSALPRVGTRYKPADILSMEIKNNGYANKGMIATNGSAFWDNWGDAPTTPFLINKGKIILDIKNTNYIRSYGFVGITKDGDLKLYNAFTQNNYGSNMAKRQTILDDGVRNNFTVFNELLSPKGELLKSNIIIKYTGLCQVDANNYVIYSGETLTLTNTAMTLKKDFNCKSVYRFDGGGSTAFYYKKNNSATPTSIRSGRDLPDMMYFVEQ